MRVSRSHSYSLAVLLVTMAFVGGCGDSTEPTPTVNSVVVTPGAVDSLIGVGDMVQFGAEAQDANANPVAGSSFTWTSSDEAVATVDSTGLVTTVANGTTTLTAEEAGGVTGTATFKSATVAAVEMLTIDFDALVSGASGSAVGLTYDGSSYYTIYDGVAPSPILKHDLAGAYVSSTTANTDARALLYNEADGVYYLKHYGTNWYAVDPDNGTLTTLLTGIFADIQSSPALSGDGTQIIEQSGGSVRFLNIATGAEEGTLTGLTVGGSTQAGSEAIATDGSYLFTIDPTTVYMYDMEGRPVTSFDVPNSLWGIALSYANGMLWVTSTSGAQGTWYGYELVQQ
jgi:hypothetical protein